MGKIIWVASYPKSGNTWVRAFLANLFGPGDEPRDLNRLNEVCPSLTGRALYDARLGRSTRDLPPQEILQLRQQVEQVLCNATPDSIFVKTHSWFGEQFGLPLIDPQLTAGAIYIVRNPLDVAVSAANHYGVSVENMVAHMADPNFCTAPSDRHVVEYIGSWSQNVASWTWQAHPKVHVIRYEDLFAATEARFADLVSFLGLKPPPHQFKRALRHSQFSALAEQERKSGFKERSENADVFFRHGKPGQGREVLPPSLIDAITTTHREQMARFGYLT
jgi:hypothetical protein